VTAVIADSSPATDPVVSARADELSRDYERKIHVRTDRLFAGLMGLQWVAGVLFALWVSPLAWAGGTSRTHLHVWAALLLGGLLSVFPAALALLRPGERSTRYVIAVAQMLMGALLIHLTGGRIETHFHVFGSLAFLAFYRDWRVLVPATVVVALDHLLRGYLWPQSVYGVIAASPWRWLEHAGWVIFEDVFLIVGIYRSMREMRDRAERTAALEHELRTRAVLVEDLQKARTQAEAATRAKSDFLASMSHELRTPLNAIILYSELLEEEAIDRPGDQSVDDLRKIQSAGKHLLELINGILDLSKIEAGKMTVTPEEFDVRSMLQDVVDTVRPLVHKNGNTLTVHVADSVATVNADIIKTRQIVLNLVSNAAKFTRLGTVTIEVTRSSGGARDYLEFHIADTGVGMTAEQIRRIFEPFTQADVSTSRKYGGTGLGLAIVSSLCQLMDGSISVDSRPDAGSRFTVLLPVQPLETAETPVSHNAAA
jgi:signal transduction histidine kinase